MKLVSFFAGDRSGFGAVEGRSVHDLTGLIPGVNDLRSFLADAHNMDHAHAHLKENGGGARLNLSDVQLLPVIPNPDKIICVGLNYRDHVAEQPGREPTMHPALFARYADSQVGHGSAILIPAESDKLDFEGELAIVIGKGGRRIAATEAPNHVAGYSCYNDGSIRDWQNHTTQFTAGKTFFRTGGFGPWLVTPDEFGEIETQRLTTRLNGEVVQQTEFSMMINSVPKLIEYISTILPLLPGDVIVSGTPAGVGMRRQPPLWMKSGDTVEVEITGIGTLVNPVASEAVGQLEVTDFRTPGTR